MMIKSHSICIFCIYSLLCISCLVKIDSVVYQNKQFVVIDGLITNNNVPYTIKITRSINNVDEPVSFEGGAEVYVEDDKGMRFLFQENSTGIYVSDPQEFIGQVGQQYKLFVHTSDGESYESDWCRMTGSSSLDNVYYEKEDFYSMEQMQEVSGISIMVDANLKERSESYLRWVYEEDWKFRTQFKHRYSVSEDDELIYEDPPYEYCWKNNKSSSITLRSFLKHETGEVSRLKLVNFDPNYSDRFSKRYCITVKQYVISKEEYLFWQCLKEISNSESTDRFGKQPYSIRGNIHNVHSSERDAIGFFHVSSVSSKRLYIARNDIYNLGYVTPEWDRECEVKTFPVDENNPDSKYNSPYEAYEDLIMSGLYDIVGVNPSPFTGKLVSLHLADTYCFDCALSGSVEAPDFWEPLQ